MLPISKKKVPMPAVVRPPSDGPRRRKYPFEEMAVGQHFLVPNKTTLSTHVSNVSKQLDRKFETRSVYMKKVDKEYVICDEGERGAVPGVGVWRTA